MRFTICLGLGVGAAAFTPAPVLPRLRARARHLSRSRATVEGAQCSSTEDECLPDDASPTLYTLGIVGDLHLDPRTMDDHYEGRGHIKAALDEADHNQFIVSLGDLGESKDCTETKQLCVCVPLRALLLRSAVGRGPWAGAMAVAPSRRRCRRRVSLASRRRRVLSVSVPTRPTPAPPPPHTTPAPHPPPLIPLPPQVLGHHPVLQARPRVPRRVRAPV